MLTSSQECSVIVLPLKEDPQNFPIGPTAWGGASPPDAEAFLYENRGWVCARLALVTRWAPTNPAPSLLLVLKHSSVVHMSLFAAVRERVFHSARGGHHLELGRSRGGSRRAEP